MKVFYLSLLFIKSLLICLWSPSVLAFQDGDLQNSRDLLVSYSEISNVAKTLDQGVHIRIYNTGDVSVIIPDYMKQAGLYHVRLEQEEMDALWLLLTDEEILTFDAQAVRNELIRERQFLKESQALVSSVSDKTDIVLEFFPNRYPPAGFPVADGNEAKCITWSGLRWDVEQYPQIKPIQLLSEIQTFFLAILRRKDLQPIDP